MEFVTTHKVPMSSYDYTLGIYCLGLDLSQLIGNVYCNDNQDKIKYQRERLSLAKERIEDFPTLSSIFNKFEDYEIMLNKGKTIPSNVVFNLISSDNYNNTYTQRNLLQSPGTCNSIKELEDALNQFFVSNPVVKKEYREFCKRLTDGDNFASIQAYNEIIIAYDIGKKIGFKNVHLHYESLNGKKPDLHLNLDAKHIFLELTALEMRVPEKKINVIASSIANYILKKSSKSNYLISILFDTMIVNRFIDNLGHILEKAVIAYLKEMIDRLRLEELIGLNGSFDFHDRRIYLHGLKSFFSTPTEAIFHIDSEYDESKKVLESSTIEILDSIKTKQDLKDYPLFESWAQKVRLNDFLNSPFDTVGFSTGGNNGCVYVNSLDFDSTDENLRNSYLVSTSQIAKTSFIDHIKRRIDYKVKKAQYEVGSSFVIGIQATQWQFEYEYDYDDFVPIRNEIQDHLKKYPEVSGVILFTFDIYQGKFIENPDASQIVTKDEFENSRILYQHAEPQFTHDRKVELSNMNIAQKAARIVELITKENSLEIPQDGRLTGYVREDIEEILKNIRAFLAEETVEQKMLSLIEPIVKKYCQFKTINEDIEHREHPITEKQIWCVCNRPIRAYSAACLMRLAWHLPTPENIALINSLSVDSNSFVREAICGDLAYFWDIKAQNCILIAERYFSDNKFVRWYLRTILDYLVHKDRKRALEMFLIIIHKYGKKPMEGDGEGILLDYAVSKVTQASLLLQEPEYIKLLEDMVTNLQYDLDVKKAIMTTMREERFIKGNPTLIDRIIQYYVMLFKNNSLQVKVCVEFFFLFELIQKNGSLLPKINLLLNEISLMQYAKPAINYDHTFHFTIVDYIDKFFESFPKAATAYFLKIMELNEFLTDSLKTSAIIRILEKIFNSNIEVPIKKQAKLILNKMDMEKYWQARNLAEKVKDL